MKRWYSTGTTSFEDSVHFYVKIFDLSSITKPGLTHRIDVWYIICPQFGRFLRKCPKKYTIYTWIVWVKSLKPPVSIGKTHSSNEGFSTPPPNPLFQAPRIRIVPGSGPRLHLERGQIFQLPTIKFQVIWGVNPKMVVLVPNNHGVFLLKMIMLRCFSWLWYCWWFRNPIPKHLECIQPFFNNGEKNDSTSTGAGFLPSTVC